MLLDRKSTRLNSSHTIISYAVFCLKKKKPRETRAPQTPRRPHPRAPPRLRCRVDAPLLPLSHSTGPVQRLLFYVSLFFFLKVRAPPKFSLFPPPAPFPS